MTRPKNAIIKILTNYLRHAAVSRRCYYHDENNFNLKLAVLSLTPLVPIRRSTWVKQSFFFYRKKMEEMISEAENNPRKRGANPSEEMDVAVEETGTEITLKPTEVVSSTKKVKKSSFKYELRKVSVPAHRYTPLKENWVKIFTPVVEHLNLQIRFNLKTRQVELRTCEATKDIANLQKGADFVKAFVLGFEVEDALALLRLDDLFIESFEVTDVKPLKGSHLSRAIGRLAGKSGRTKYTIENATKTRIVLADSKIHVLGSFNNIQLARRAICDLILGSPPSKVYGQLRNIVGRMSNRL